MKKTLLVLLIVCALVAAALEAAERAARSRVVCVPASPVACAIPAKPVRPDRSGEKIVYDVKLGMVKLGTAVYEQQKGTELGGSKVELFTFETRLMRLVDKERIFSDPETALPVRVERDVLIWPKHEIIIEEYDQKNHSVTVTKGGRTQTITIGGPHQNAILLPFSIRRSARLEQGWSAKVNPPTQQLEITLVGSERVQVPAGEFETHHFTSVPAKFEVWVTADKDRVPVKIKGTGAIGYVMFMSSYSPPGQRGGS